MLIKEETVRVVETEDTRGPGMGFYGFISHLEAETESGEIVSGTYCFNRNDPEEIPFDQIVWETVEEVPDVR